MGGIAKVKGPYKCTLSYNSKNSYNSHSKKKSDNKKESFEEILKSKINAKV